jgi:hypothetical protein
MDSPWMNNKEWASGRIPCKTGRAVVLLWVMAVLSNGLIWTTMLILWRNTNERNALKVVALFSLLGFLLLYLALRQTWRWLRVGRQVFELASIPGVMGGILEGVIQTGLKAIPGKPIRLSLTCSRQVLVKAVKSRKSENQEMDHFETTTLWQMDRTLPVTRSGFGPTGVSFPVCLQIPYGLPESDHSKTDDQILWKLAASCEAPAFRSEFLVPVFATAKSNPGWTVEKVDAMAEQEEQSEATGPPAAVTLETVVTVSQTSLGGREYSFRPKLSPGLHILMPLSGLLIIGGSAGLYLWLGELGPFAFLPGILGILLLSATLIAWTYRSRVRLESGFVTLKKSILGIPLTWKIPFSKIKGVRVRHEIIEGVSGKDRGWDIDIHRSDEKPVKIGATLRDRNEAESLAQEIFRLTRSGY